MALPLVAIHAIALAAVLDSPLVSRLLVLVSPDFPQALPALWVSIVAVSAICSALSIYFLISIGVY